MRIRFGRFLFIRRRFGILFGALSTAGQTIAYRFGIRPEVGYKPATHPRITRFQLLAALNRTAGYAATGYLSSLVAHREHAIAVGLRTGLAIGVVTAIAGFCTPFIEWTADGSIRHSSFQGLREDKEPGEVHRE